MALLQLTFQTTQLNSTLSLYSLDHSGRSSSACCALLEGFSHFTRGMATDTMPSMEPGWCAVHSIWRRLLSARSVHCYCPCNWHTSQWLFFM